MSMTKKAGPSQHSVIAKAMRACYSVCVMYEEDDDTEERVPMRRLPLMAHGSVSRSLILFLIAAIGMLTYGWFLLTTPSTQDKRVCGEWLEQYSKRVNNSAIFEKVGCSYVSTSATSHGIYTTVNIYVDKPCPHLPRPIDLYLSHNKLGMLMFVRIYAEGDESPCCSEIF